MTFNRWAKEIRTILNEHKRNYWWHGEFELEIFLYTNEDDEFELGLEEFEEDIRIAYLMQECAIGLIAKEYAFVITCKPMKLFVLEGPLASGAA